MRRYLHTMFRVSDLEKSIDFYTNTFGMTLLRRKDFPGGKFTLAYLGYGEEKDHTVIELTHNWETDSYEMGNAYGHIAIGVDDVYAACEEFAAKGAEIPRPAGPMKGTDTVIAFVKDPDGYMIELIENSRFQ